MRRKLTPVVRKSGKGDVLCHRIGSVQAVFWQAGTNWAGPVRIQIYYCPEWDKGLKGTDVNRIYLNINGRSLEFTLTVPLKSSNLK